MYKFERNNDISALRTGGREINSLISIMLIINIEISFNKSRFHDNDVSKL